MVLSVKEPRQASANVMQRMMVMRKLREQEMNSEVLPDHGERSIDCNLESMEAPQAPEII
jgi:hypothetical protein